MIGMRTFADRRRRRRRRRRVLLIKLNEVDGLTREGCKLFKKGGRGLKSEWLLGE
jgi:hypothetical protein